MMRIDLLVSSGLEKAYRSQYSNESGIATVKPKAVPEQWFEK